MNEESTGKNNQDNTKNTKITHAARFEICPNMLIAISLIGNIIIFILTGSPGR
jgi:hypothetical protein